MYIVFRRPSTAEGSNRVLASKRGFLMPLCLVSGFFLSNHCLGDDPSQINSVKTTPYYHDAQICRGKNPGDKSTTSFPDLAASIDETGYLMCMEDLGYQQEASSDPLLRALVKCQKEVPTISAKGVKTLKPPTSAMFRDCLGQRGFSSSNYPSPRLAQPTDQSGTSGNAPRRDVEKTPGKAVSEPMRTLVIPGEELNAP